MDWFNALPEGLKTWLAGASADAAGGFVAELAIRLLDSTSARLRRRLQGDPQEQALARALTQALAAALQPFDLEADLETHTQALFEAWLRRAAVVEELATLLDPGEEDLDRDLLSAEFSAAGSDVEWLVDVDFDAVIDLLVAGFVTAAAGEEALQEPLKIKLLGQMAQRVGAMERFAEMQATQGRQAAGHLHRIDLLTQQLTEGQDVTNDLLLEMVHLLGEALEQDLGMQQQAVQKAETTLYKVGIKEGTGVAIGDNASVTMTADLHRVEQLLEEIRRNLSAPGDALSTDELATMEATYRQRIVEQFETLTFKGMSPSGRPIALPLEKVYVELKAVAEVPEAADAFSADERRLLLEAEGRGADERSETLLQLDSLRLQRWKEQGRRDRTAFQRRSIHETLADPTQRGVVILGDPGSGKTTLLQYLALSEARKGPTEPGSRLPIFVPLAAYDDFVRRDKATNPSLVEFLAIYYDQWHSLPGLRPLFQQALSQGRALILLDGLDEVLDQTTRQFVAEQAGALIQQWTSQGNRFALTSRIVGYREARLSGNLPHVTVLDFGRPEIDVFARQWTRAYEAWAAGKETPTTLQQAESERKALLDDVHSNASVERLAANPLMLTMLALLRRQVGKLPDRRIELYERYVRTLIDNWEASRSQGARRQAPERFDPHRAIDHLIELALWLQRTYPSGTARTADVTQELTRICLRFEGHDPDASATPARERVRAEQDAERFLQDMRHFAGLLAERGRNAFGFLHLTFQEYFVGRALARLSPDDRWAIVQPNLHNPRWREPILLCAGQLGIAENRRDQATAFVERILAAGSPHEPLLHRDLFLAGAIAADDVGLAAAVRDGMVEPLDTLTLSAIPIVQDTVLASLAQLARRGSDLAQTSLLRLLDRRQLQSKIIRIASPVLGSETCLSLRRAVEAKLDDEYFDIRESAVQALAPLVPTDADARHRIEAKLDDSLHYAVRIAAVKALASLVLTDADTRHRIEAKLDDSSHDAVRIAAVKALAPLVPADNDVRRSIEAKLDDSGYDVRIAAVQSLAMVVSSDGDTKCSVEDRLDDPKHEVRTSAVQALAPLAPTDDHIRRRVEAKLDDLEHEVRTSAIQALAVLIPTDDHVRRRAEAKLDDLYSDVRIAAVKSLAPLLPTDGDARCRVEAKLDDPYYDVRIAAVQVLASLVPTDDHVRGRVEAKIDDPDYDVRIAAVQALALLLPTDGDARRRVEAKLDDPHYDVRIAAVQSLAPLLASDSDARRRVEAKPDIPEWDVRKAAVKVLTPLILNDRDARRRVESKLDDPAYGVRKAAVQALVPLVPIDADVRRFFETALDNPQFDVRTAAVQALAPLVPTDGDARRHVESKLDDPVDEVRKAAVQALAPLVPTDGDARRRLEAKLDDPHFTVRTAAVQALALLVPTDMDARHRLETKLNDSDAYVRTAAVEALALLVPTDMDARHRMEAKLDDSDAYVRRVAVEALAPLLPGNNDVRCRVEARLDDSDANVRRCTVQAFFSIDADARRCVDDKLHYWEHGLRIAAVQALAPLVRSDADARRRVEYMLSEWFPDLRVAAVMALSPLILTDVDARRRVEYMLDDRDADVRVVAVKALAPLVSSEGVVRRRVEGKLDDSDRYVRMAAVVALSPLIFKDVDARRRVEYMLDDRDSDLRAVAVKALAPLMSSEGVVRRRVEDKLDDPQYHVQLAAMQALAPLVLTDSNVRRLFETKLDAKRHDVRWAAVEALVPGLSADVKLPILLRPWLGCYMERGHLLWGQKTDEQVRTALAQEFALLLVENHELFVNVVDMLNSPAWPTRQGAAWALIAMPGGPPPNILPKLYGLMDDVHGLESWPERLRVAALLINDRDRAISQHAVRVAAEALDYGTQPWYYLPESGRDVRKQAALILGQLEPLYRDEAIFERLVRVMLEDADEQVRDAAYGALLRLAAAPEEQSRIPE